ncbi:MAG: hypothetical protein EXS48_02925 [Candidatus Staskawiczbacteria bacterium]|nr:hypothetical protein [Candidatus Staskawiczbacteria bacterium]
MTEELKKLISEAKNICIIPPQSNEPESLTAGLALFYTLRELGKNVNLITDQFPENLQFLIPSLDFITQPKNFVISIPNTVADISQVYYEKNENDLKIHLTIEKGQVKKDNISFYFTDSKPDLIITLGIADFRKELENKLDSFGYLLSAPVINISSEIISISEETLDIIKNTDGALVSKNVAHCILTGLTMHYQNFQNQNTAPEVFELCAMLMKQGADRQQILSNLYKPEIKKEVVMG